MAPRLMEEMIDEMELDTTPDLHDLFGEKVDDSAIGDLDECFEDEVEELRF